MPGHPGRAGAVPPRARCAGPSRRPGRCAVDDTQPRSDGSSQRWTTHPVPPGTTSPVITTSRRSGGERERWARRPRAGGASGTPGIGHVERAVGIELGLPATAVRDLVVTTAQDDQVVRGGHAAALPRHDVVRLAPLAGAVAAGPAAVVVAYEEGVPQRRRHRAGGAGGLHAIRRVIRTGNDDPRMIKRSIERVST